MTPEARILAPKNIRFKQISSFFLSTIKGSLAVSLPIEASNELLYQTTFIKESEFGFSARNILRTGQDNKTGHQQSQLAWGQGLVFDYRSGYLADFMGFDASYYRVIKLAANDSFASQGILYNAPKTPFAEQNNAQGFGKFAQVYGKLRFDTGNVKTNLYTGWRKIGTIGALATSTRAVSNTYLGWSGNISMAPYTMNFAYVTRGSNRDSPHQTHFKLFNGTPISSIITGDIQYISDQFSVIYFYGEGKGYLGRHGLETIWQYRPHWQLTTQTYFTEGFHKWKQLPNSTSSQLNNKAFDHQAWHYAADITWFNYLWTTKLGFAFTQAYKTNGIGIYPLHMFANSRGRFNTMSSTGIDYINHGEKMIALDMNYALTPELAVGVSSNYGFFDYQNQRINENDTAAYIRWIPQQNRLKGLSLSSSIGPAWFFQHHRHVPLMGDNGDIRRAKSLLVTWILDYKISF